MKFLECLRPPVPEVLRLTQEKIVRAYDFRKNRDDHSSLSLRLHGRWCSPTDLSSGGGVPIFLHLFIQGEGGASVISRETP